MNRLRTTGDTKHPTGTFLPSKAAQCYHCGNVSDHEIQSAMLAVQALALVGLIFYAIETYRLRRASQRTLEAMAKPCITFWAELRNPEDAILDMGGATGNLVARPDGGSYVIHNLGNGIALNLRYYITRNNHELDAPDRQKWRYIPTIPTGAKVALVETVGGFNAQHEATFEYESIGRRKYRSTITLNQRVITSFKFEET